MKYDLKAFCWLTLDDFKQCVQNSNVGLGYG